PTPVFAKPRIWKRTFDRRTVLGGAVGAASAIAVGVKSTAAGSALDAPVFISSNKQTVANLVDGTALVSSPKLPLFGVGENDLPGLFNGSTTDWSSVGSPAPIAVKTVALADNVPAGMTPSETFANYDELANHLWDNPGAVAVVPVDQVDFRANVLSVQGFDPLRDQAGDAAPMRVAFVGDIVPGRNVSAKIAYYGSDWVRPFRKIAPELKSYDTVIANLEGNVSANIAAPTDPHTFSFVSDPAFIEGLVYGGIDAVSLANNHSVWNDDGWGLSAFNDTRAALDQYGIPHFGAGDNIADASAPWVVEAKGLKIAIYGVDGVTANNEQSAGVLADYVGATADGAGTNPFATDQFTSDIQSLASQYDVVIPYFHMGVEYVPIPPDWALQGARNAIDAGATMVVTNHPHLIQGMEVYNGKPIVYSVGNFVFDQMFSN
ncbi:MAG: CapA family protein, partial [Thermomicrobiales bacterium]